MHKSLRVREARLLVADFGRRRSNLRSDSDQNPLRAARQRRALRRERSTDVGGTLDLGRTYRIRLDLGTGQSVDEALAAYRSRADVEYAERNPIISICAMPSDPLSGEQWALPMIRAPDAWDTCRGDREIIVAVIDTGVDYTHRDLQGNLWVNEAEGNGVAGVDDDGNGYIDDIRGYNFAADDADPADDHGHGTHCAGTIAAVGNNGLDIAGVCWNARIMPLKVLASDGEGSVADAVPAIYYAVANGADVISISWGGDESSETLKEAVAYADRKGVIVVSAAGNKGSDIRYYPAAYPEVVSVTATDASDRRWYLANYGDWVDLAAPGRDILSLRATQTARGTARDPFTTRMSGTSMAVPQVSGACALLRSANPFLTCDEVHEILTKTVDPIEKGICASDGRLNVYQALRAAIPAEGTVRLDRTYYAERADIGVLLADWDLRGVGRGMILMETDAGDVETVALTETAVSLGVFRGTMASEPADPMPGNGVLEVQDGETIRARYLDGGDSPDDAGQWREVTAMADYKPPVVFGMGTQRRGATATVEVLTDEPTRAEIRYGQTCGGPYDLTEADGGLAERHLVELKGLNQHAAYCFVVVLTDAAGNETHADNGGRGYSLPVEAAPPGSRVRRTP
jgi:subtilisin family serine protease